MKLTSSRKKWLWVCIGAGIVILLSIVLAFSLSGRNQPNTRRNASHDSRQTDETLARSLAPCKLLTDTERATFDLGKGELDDTHIRGCDWDQGDNLYLHASIYPLYGLDKTPEWPDVSIEPLTIGSHAAQLIMPRPGSVMYGACAVDIAFGPNKHATIKVTGNGKFSETPDQDKYCNIVKQIAAFIETKLP